jgi:hypothetical protein
VIEVELMLTGVEEVLFIVSVNFSSDDIFNDFLDDFCWFGFFGFLPHM